MPENNNEKRLCPICRQDLQSGHTINRASYGDCNGHAFSGSYFQLGIIAASYVPRLVQQNADLTEKANAYDWIEAIVRERFPSPYIPAHVANWIRCQMVELKRVEAKLVEHEEMMNGLDAIQIRDDGRCIIRLPIGWGWRDGTTLGDTALEAFQSLKEER